MCLTRRPAIVKRGADVQDLAAVVFEPRIVSCARHVPRPLGIDVDHRSEPIRAQLGGSAKEIPGSVIDHEVERSQLGDNAIDGRADDIGLANVGDNR